jgi:putative transcriptional regulator
MSPSGKHFFSAQLRLAAAGRLPVDECPIGHELGEKATWLVVEPGAAHLAHDLHGGDVDSPAVEREVGVGLARELVELQRVSLHPACAVVLVGLLRDLPVVARPARGDDVDGEIEVVEVKNDRAKAVRFSTLSAICRELDCQPGDLLRYRG